MGGLDLVITGGTVVTAADSYTADIGIKDGRIAQIGTGLAASERIDATGLLVLPGGICKVSGAAPRAARSRISRAPSRASASRTALPPWLASESGAASAGMG